MTSLVALIFGITNCILLVRISRGIGAGSNFETSKFLSQVILLHHVTSALCRTDGVWVSILGANVTNNSYVALDDLIATNETTGLHCNTNKMGCCRGSDASMRCGNWYFPNNSRVLFIAQISDVGAAFVRNRDDRGIVRMFCSIRGSSCSMQSVSTASLLRGRYRCEVPNASNINITSYVNICTLYSASNRSGCLDFSRTHSNF